MEQRKAHEAEAEARRSMVGSGERSEKIRTYNFPQDRVTDHRIGVDLHNLPNVLDGDLDRLLDELISTDQAQRLAEFEGGRGCVTGFGVSEPGCSAPPSGGGHLRAQARRRTTHPAVVRATDLTGVHVLKHDNLFMLSDAYGDVHIDGRGLGLYDTDTRVLSTYDLRLNGIRPGRASRRTGGQLPGDHPADQSRLRVARTRSRTARRSSCAASRWG